MITLYHCVSARSFRPLWMLEELGQPYELKMLPFPPRALDRSYLAINPLGTVPALFDGATRMTESAAMCQYLAAKAAPGTLDVSVDEPDFGAYLNYLHFGEATLTFPQTLVLRYGRFEPAERRSPQVAEDYSKWFYRVCAHWNRCWRRRNSCVPDASPRPMSRWHMPCYWRNIWDWMPNLRRP